MKMRDVPPGQWYRRADGELYFKASKERIVGFDPHSRAGSGSIWVDSFITSEQEDEAVWQCDVDIALTIK